MAMMTRRGARRGLAAAGIPRRGRAPVACHVDDLMKDCILRLYRSAVHVGEEWEADVARDHAPGAHRLGRDDPYVAPRFAERLAARVRGELVFLEGCGHWWPLERPAEAAAALERVLAAHG